MSEDIKITIRTDAKFRPERLLFSTVFAFTLILPGHFLDSPAMEWLGFLVIVFVGLLAIPLATLNRDEGLTFDQARSRIDEIEKLDR